MKIKAQSIRVLLTLDGKAEYIITSNEKPTSDVNDLSGKELSVEIKPYRKSRSLDANNYLWVLCQKIAEVIRSTKEEVYRKAIKEVGQFDFVAVTEKATEQFIKAWQSKGLGWYAEALESKIDGCKKVMVYYGSSVYDSKEMSVLIDYIVDECKGLNVEVLPPWEVERLKREWRG